MTAPLPDFHRLPADASLFSIIGHNSIVHSPSFTFLVGPDHTKLTIQSGLAKHVSQRLDELMNNGHTRESRHRIAVLEEEDVETFVGFCEYAYTGDYTVPNPRVTPIGRRDSQGNAGMAPPLASAIRPPAPSPPVTPQPGEEPQDIAAGGGEGEGVAAAGGDKVEEQDEDGNQAGDSGKGKKGKKGKKKQKGGKAAQDLEEGAAANMTPPRTPPQMTGDQKDENELAQQEAGEAGAEEAEPTNPEEIAAATPHIPPSEAVSAAPDWFDFEATPKPEMPKLGPAFQGSFISPKSRGLGLWGEFASLQYIHHQRTSGGMALPSPLSRNTPGYGIAVSGNEPAPYLLFHAKLYVFATRFLIPTLAQLTLKKLHRDLVSFPLSTKTADHLSPTSAAAVIQLLHFTFTRTKRDDPVFSLTSPDPNAHRQNELRKLVTHYAACKVRELASYQPPTPEAASMESMDMMQMGFRDLLDALGELASDLVYRMM
ncbi:uncharacterized protein BDCG_08068 [Blastomyces dermatitidis ER-3]|uniref:BTB domain-containing protein n=1 Tax=Ajellomyces dermatitidis (strain ER-3 / ATCC MYA-2586) TaxID=559297 RepID=A0ABP2EN23_AJEDR|nr:uncharacterized protein BDCG_08068 [Blastomyces dermatitidis ER-3]EEQ84799.2 hypothetical protein BDCG_08068 [Blastomyces dermatitidis ER-3]